MRAKILMILSFCAISIGLYGVLNPKEVHSVNPLKEIVEKKDVHYRAYIVKNDVNYGEYANLKHFEARRITEEEASDFGLYEDTVLQIPSGSVYQRNLKKDTVITQNDIIKPEENGYIDAIIKPNHVPYAVKVNPETVVGGLIDSGTKIDVLAITQPSEGYGNTQISIEPILTGIKVLQVKKEQQANTASKGATQSTNNHLILELTRKQVAQLTVAKKIAQIEVHKSIGDYSLNDLSANAGDVLPNFKAIKEFGANQVTVK